MEEANQDEAVTEAVAANETAAAVSPRREEEGSSSSATTTTAAAAASGTPSKSRGRKKARSKIPQLLTKTRVAHIVNELGNERGSTVRSIWNRLQKSGFQVDRPKLEAALQRAVDDGLLREVREERFTVLHKKNQKTASTRQDNADATAAAAAAPGAANTSRGGAMVAFPVTGKMRFHLVSPLEEASSSSTSSTSPADAKPRRRRRPRQGRHPAVDAAEEGNAGGDNHDNVDDSDTDADTDTGGVGEAEAQERGGGNEEVLNTAGNP